MGGPAWAERGRPAAGYFTRRLAEDWLRDALAAARRGELPGALRTGVAFQEAAGEWLRYVEHDRDVKPSTLSDYRSAVNGLLTSFGGTLLERITSQMIEAWRAGLGEERAKRLSNRTRNKLLTIMGGIMERAMKVHGLSSNPVRDVEKLRERYDATEV